MLLLAAGVAAGAWYLGVGKTVQVPTVAGLTAKEASAKLTPLGLTLDASAEAYSETVKAGDIIKTDPPVGTEVREGTTVTATVSQGPERYEVPKVSGMTLEEATAAIEDSSLVVGKVTKDWSEKVKKDLVISSSPKSTTSLKKGQAIDLVLSKGPAPVKIPSLTGQTKDDATAALTGAGLKVTYAEDYSKNVAEGSVVSSTPKAGTTVPQGGTVTLVISKGPPLVEMPDLFRTDEKEAVKALKALGLKVKVTYPIGFTPFGRVVEQSVKAGTQIPWGTTVQINVV